LPDPISKITRIKWTGGITQAVEHALQAWALSFQTLVPQKRKKEKKGPISSLDCFPASDDWRKR
jgi:hypothetical protein